MIKLRDQKAVELFAEHIEAQRCWHIFDTEICRLRPGASWAILPLGLNIVETLSMIEKFPVEPGSDAFYEKYIRVLHTCTPDNEDAACVRLLSLAT